MTCRDHCCNGAGKTTRISIGSSVTQRHMGGVSLYIPVLVGSESGPTNQWLMEGRRILSLIQLRD
ncbi:hypothetical protein GGP41_003895 [Bipolaris sorokiniana]|uniref:Uncharacterized protein n=1 Tax=Cochliobolus sativus TaxID=45130 RepID=A0A8H6DRX2_COCSA|nr:hypothetical protein GGP41_003895 [Bipolaris sorokiniana]